MKQIKNIIKVIALAALPLLYTSCQNDTLAEVEKPNTSDGVELKMTVDFGASTRLAELPDPGAMNDGVINDKDYGLNNVGLYIYYTEDYEKGNLAQPYIRNKECHVEDGELKVILNEGDNPEDGRVYIYDHMTIVAFYPYNASMSEPQNHFKSLKDEEKYPITKQDYSEQYYIPYKAVTKTNPSIAYNTTLTFVPKHTYKIELVLVAEEVEEFPTGEVMILPETDPVTNTDLEKDRKREVWFDRINELDNGGGGSHVRQYIGYIFTTEADENEIKRGDVLLESEGLTLIASHDVQVTEDYVYRYGYNLTTGEIFIPTSTGIVHDVPSLQGISGKADTWYQACDIDLSSAGNWNPLHILGGRYDGGGHKLYDMTLTTDKPKAGLFEIIQGNAIVANVNLINPKITVNHTGNDTVYVGAIAAFLNDEVTQEDINTAIGNLPPGLSQVVKDELINKLLVDLSNSQANLVSTRVVNPEIKVTGLHPRVGTIVGRAGYKSAKGNFKSSIWDTYSLDGSITVNQGNPKLNEVSFVGGFVGLNAGHITRSYTTINQITTEDSKGNRFQGFSNIRSKSADISITTSYTQMPDINEGVTQFTASWPSGWITYEGIWPQYYTGWLTNSSNSFWYKEGAAPSTYPTLHWERR